MHHFLVMICMIHILTLLLIITKLLFAVLEVLLDFNMSLHMKESYFLVASFQYFFKLLGVIVMSRDFNECSDFV